MQRPALIPYLITSGTSTNLEFTLVFRAAPPPAGAAAAIAAAALGARARRRAAAAAVTLAQERRRAGCPFLSRASLDPTAYLAGPLTPSPPYRPGTMVRLMASKREIPVPEGVTVEVSARHVKVSGPRGKLERAFKHAKVQRGSTPRIAPLCAGGLSRRCTLL